MEGRPGTRYSSSNSLETTTVGYDGDGDLLVARLQSIDFGSEDLSCTVKKYA